MKIKVEIHNNEKHYKIRNANELEVIFIMESL
jgi:hypothetical protein